jgi:xanthine dehydrogenase YagR molybdenum-binding subunit
MKTVLNGQPCEFEPEVGDTVIDVVRDQVGLTGTKLVCGAGVCGACTVLVDGVPMTSCLLPAQQLEGRSVQTVEGHAAPDLHPVQRAFMAADALQCGFCTPGFVNEAIAFYERWRAERAGEVPSRDEIAAALSGHLCRCGAYLGIYEAVARACAGEFDTAGDLSPARVDARAKVTGEAKYTVDVHYDGQLEARFVRSEVAHAHVKAVDFSAALSESGVVGAIELLDEADRIVRFVGQPIAVVAASTARLAHEAARRVEVTYDELPFVIDKVEAERGSATVYEGKPKDAPNSSEGPIPPGRFDGNVRRARGGGIASQRARKARRLIRDAETNPDLELISGTWRTPDQIHTALEPHAAVAIWDGPDALTLHASTQTVDLMSREVAKHFHLKKENVKVRAPYVGGAFGAKQGLGIEAIAAIKLAQQTGTAVRVANDRLEEMVTGGHRPASSIDVDVVASRSGDLEAMRIDAAGYCGIAVNSAHAMIGRLVYPKVPKLLADRDVFTNTPPGKPFRAPFAPPLFWAVEGSVDETADRLGIDPIDLHRRWDPHTLRPHLYDWASRLDVWRTRAPAGADSGRFRRGVGFAMGSWANIYYAGTVVEVSTSADGITARTAIQDMGQGARSVLAAAVAETFDLDPNDVDVDIGDSGEFRGPGSSASRTTNAVYAPTKDAAATVRDKLIAAARDELQLVDPAPASGGVSHGDGFMSWPELVAKVAPQRATARRGSNGTFDLLGKLPSGNLAMNLGRPTTSAVYVCEVVVDTRFGIVKVPKVWGGLAVGKLVVPALARSQVYGGVIQGIGYALYEERHLDPHTGTVLSLGLEEFRIPGIGDMPEIELFFHEDGFEHNKGGGVGLSEVSTIPVAAAVGNAVFHATGHRYREIPLRPDRILEGVGT